jgi:hypothetical protein
MLEKKIIFPFFVEKYKNYPKNHWFHYAHILFK